MKIGSLFSGIGGLELGLEQAGLGEVVWQCETNSFCCEILERHWPGVKRYHDVKEVEFPEWVDLICGGFPCQDVSSAGKGVGLSGSRSGLWVEFARIVESVHPTWVVVENVASGAKKWVDVVRRDLERIGYVSIPIPIAAQDLGAPHLRRRIFIVAHTQRDALWNESERESRRSSNGVQRQRQAESLDHGAQWDAANATEARLQGTELLQRPRTWKITPGSAWATDTVPQPAVCRMDDGLSRELGKRMAPEIRALGNAVVPQCAEVVGHVIQILRDERL